ncbi:hypothetical protein OEZ86_014628 [Tetradesmus obliquus]|nr:hypothetical protein OEZ86_014628 [Tetradesmus obliquus]
MFAPWATEQQMQEAFSWQPQPAPSSLLGWSSGKFAVLSAADCALLLDAVLLPQLQRLNLDIPARPLDLPAPVPLAGLPQGLPLLQQASKLTALRQLGSLSCLRQPLHWEDWQALCSISTRFTELHLSWNCSSEGFDSDAFAQLGSSFSRLQVLSLDITALNYYSQLDELVTLTGLAGGLKVLRLSFDRPQHSLLLSLTQCSKVTELELLGPVADELLVQVVRSMPLLKRLSLGSARSYRAHDLRLLHMPGLVIDGRGIKPAAGALPRSAGAAAAAAAAADGIDGDEVHCEGVLGARGGLRSLQSVELCAAQLMRSTLPHLSYLSSLRSIVLHGMPLREFPHVCRLNCLAPLSSLQHLTSLRVLPNPSEQAHFVNLPAHVPGAAAAAAGQPPHLPAAHLQQLLQQLQQGGVQQLAQQMGLQQQPQGMQQGIQQVAQQMMQQMGLMQQPQGLQQPQGPQQPQGLQQGMQQIAQQVGQMQAAQQQGHPLQQVLQHLQALLQAGAAGVGGGGGAGNAAVPAAAAADGDEAEAAEDAAMADADAESDEDYEVGGDESASDTDDSVSDNVSDEDFEMDEDGEEEEEEEQQQQQQQQVGGALQGPLAAVMGMLNQQQQQGQQQQPPPLQPWMQRLSFEPHLHFLKGLPGLVELELGCLQTNGSCLLHLHSLPQLASLTLGGNITLNNNSWGFISQLHLPGVISSSSSSRSGLGLPALADVLGAWQGLPGHLRGRAAVFVNSQGSLVPLVP